MHWDYHLQPQGASGVPGTLQMVLLSHCINALGDTHSTGHCSLQVYLGYGVRGLAMWEPQARPVMHRNVLNRRVGHACMT